MNIGDIAKMAGVSRAAVSRYLNDGYISEEKKERIRKVIDETGYKPSLMAQTLRTKKTKLIGVVLPRVNSDSISSVVEGISLELGKSGYEMLLATTDNDPEKELEYLRVFSKNRVDGVILIATVFTKEHKKILKNMAIPVIIVGQRLPGYACVYHDDYEAGRVLTESVIKKGHQKVVYIGALKDDVAVGQMRFNGYKEAMARHSLEVTPDMVATADFSTQSGEEKMAELLEKCPDLDAVIAATDRIAFGAMRYLKQKDIGVPYDVAVAGFGDNKISAVTTPGLTTIHFHYLESGERAAHAIVEHLKGDTSAIEETKLGFELVERESV